MEKEFKKFTSTYLNNLVSSFEPKIIEKIQLLAEELNKNWENGNKVFMREWRQRRKCNAYCE